MAWLQSIGPKADTIRSVSVERSYTVPDTDGVRRRADVYLEVDRFRRHEVGANEGESNAIIDVITIEAKIDALVDDEQLDGLLSTSSASPRTSPVTF